MTEAEWLTSNDPDTLFKFVKPEEDDKARVRQTRLFACACCRRLWTEIPPDVTELLLLAERHADGKLKKGKEKLPFKESQWSGVFDQRLRAVYKAAFRYDRVDLFCEAIRSTRDIVIWEAREAHFAHLSDAAQDQLPYETFRAVTGPAESTACSVQVILLRDVFGNPFRLVAFAPGWRTDTAVAIAHGMYEARDFGAMPILADALQDAGCDNEDVLTHCRDANKVHVRGCWVVDLVLGKA